VDEKERDRTDTNLQHFAVLAEQAITQWQQTPHQSIIQTLHTQPGTGAAGGLGFALQLLGGIHTSGAQFIAELMNIPYLLKQVDWLITGEGCSDRQTLQGKAPWVVAQMAHNIGVPVTLLSGAIVPGDQVSLMQAFRGQCFSLTGGLSCCFPESDAPKSLSDCLLHAADWMRKAGLQLGYECQRQADRQASINP
jgi:glycerate kinase